MRPLVDKLWVGALFSKQMRNGVPLMFHVFSISSKDGDLSLIDGDFSFDKMILKKYLRNGYLVCVDKLKTIHGIGCANSFFCLSYRL